ncbi:hypothetical protein [Chryseobacterium sp.]|uniref:hypothetical protein n=1 Tax=Chryseobacterium sp. TaxID=1871047 RepID=UPI000EBC4476|nr:hypothetical protein [Chryseobacterium sp.]HCM34366.1 hypothetical protein [Chryseobacterium sp.]
MPKFEEAYYAKENRSIKIEDFNDIIHFGNIYCPECYIASLHIVRKQKVYPYFASNSNQEHLEDCQFFEEFISHNNLNKLIASKEIQDIERLNFLIKNNLQKAINLIIKNSCKNDNVFITTPYLGETGILNKIVKKYKYESIPRVHLSNILKKKKEYINHHLIVWGKAFIECKTVERINQLTKQPFHLKILVFRDSDKKFRFNVFLNNKQSLKHDLSDGYINFAIFGKLNENNGFLNFKIEENNHLKII